MGEEVDPLGPSMRGQDLRQPELLGQLSKQMCLFIQVSQTNTVIY